MTQVENTKLKAFTRKMRDEGSDGFAAGPWDEADEAVSARQRQRTRWALDSTRQAKQRSRKQYALSDRLLTWTAIIALLTLTVGVVGAWLSYQPSPGAAATRPISLNKTTLERFEIRLERMEQRLSTILEPYIRMLNNLDGRLKETSDQLGARIRILEMGTIPAAEEAYEARLQAIEDRLAVTMARLDEVSMLLAALDETPAGLPANDRFAEVPPPAEDWFAETPSLAQTGNITPDAGEPPGEELFIPAPPAAETMPMEPPPVMEQLEPADVPAPATALETPAFDNADEPVQATAQPVARASAAAPAAETSEPEAASEPPATRTGNWVINIASYTNENIARRKIADMRQQGVDVQLVSAEVNGRTLYRARVFGFATRQAATAEATNIQEILGLKETWIAKR